MKILLHQNMFSSLRNAMNRFFLVELFVLLLFNILLLNFPLTNSLGFEFSLLNGVLISFLAGLWFLYNLKYLVNTELKNLLRTAISGNIYFLLLPLFLTLLTIPFIKNCSLLEGLLFYVFITTPSVIIGTGLSCLSYLVSKRFSRIVFILFFLILALMPVFEIYFYPHIYFYNPILSFYPGTIYDESIPLDFKLISYRLLNTGYFGGIIYISYVYLKRIKINKGFNKLWIIFGSLIVAVVFVSLKGDLGYSTTLAGMKEQLRGVLKTKHFIIYYDKSIKQSDIEYLGLNHEYYYSEVSGYFKVNPAPKIISFIFANANQKKRLTGSETADIAKPWLHYIYINYENYENTLEHEIAHCIAGEFGVTPFKVAHSVNPALTEGIATASVNNFNDNTLHYMAGLAYNNGFKIPIVNLFKGLNFYGEVSSLSYIYSGSFIKYLIDDKGIDKFKKVYQTGKFKEVYGKTIEQLGQEYFTFIGNIGKGNVNQAVYYFGKKPLIKKVCPRVLAEQTANAWKLYNNGIYDEASEKFYSLLKYSDSYSALSGYVNSLIKLKEYEKALQILKQKLPNYNNTSYSYNIEYIFAEVSGLNKQFNKADSLYVNLIRQNPSQQFEYLSEFRHEIIKDTLLYTAYCTGSNFDKYYYTRKLNVDSISYSSVPIMIELTKALNENYNLFINQIRLPFKVNNYRESFAAYALSKYALANDDYQRAQELGHDAMNINNDGNFTQILYGNFHKMLWFQKFAKAVKMSFIWKEK